MTRYYSRNSIYSLLLVLIFFNSCNGQVKAGLQEGGASESKGIPAGYPKLKKTQGSSEYQNIHCALQDKVGNLWFGTTGEGVYCYNGKLFIQFTIKDGLRSNTVLSILEDKAGKIWFGTDNGICCYDGKSISSIPITITDNNNAYPTAMSNSVSVDKNAVWSMMQDKNGTLWFGTTNGVYCYNGTSFTNFLDNSNIINNKGLHLKMVDFIMQDKNGDMWFASGMPPGEEGLCHFDGKSITSFKPNGDGWIRTILEDKNKNLCIATRLFGVCHFDGKNFINFTEKAGIKNDDVTSILEDKAGNIWIATEHGSGELGEEGGVWRYDGKSFTKFTTKQGLIHNGVFCILEDKVGYIWFGTRNTGLSRFDGKTFTNFSE